MSGLLRYCRCVGAYMQNSRALRTTAHQNIHECWRLAARFRQPHCARLQRLHVVLYYRRTVTLRWLQIRQLWNRPGDCPAATPTISGKPEAGSIGSERQRWRVDVQPTIKPPKRPACRYFRLHPAGMLHMIWPLQVGVTMFNGHDRRPVGCTQKKDS